MYYHKAYFYIYYLTYKNNLNDLKAPEVASGMPEFCNFSIQSYSISPPQRNVLIT